jgi:hypothetical protein
MRALFTAGWLTLLGFLLGGCELLGIPSPERERATKEAEGRAVGAACRHAGRAIEDCYTMNPKALKSSVFEGWKEMNKFMAENKLEVQTPLLTDKADDFKSSRKREPALVPGGFPPADPLVLPSTSGSSAAALGEEKASILADEKSKTNRAGGTQAEEKSKSANKPQTNKPERSDPAGGKKQINQPDPTF